MTVRASVAVCSAATVAFAGLVLVGPPVVGAQPSPHGAAVAVAKPPNVVVIMTDDQRRNTFQTMPTVRKKLIQKGLKYVGFSPTSACCPARSSFLTAQFAHTTGVYNNVDPTYGGWPAFHASGYEEQTIAVALDDAGYRTGLIGKYMNLWNQAPDDFVPPGWDGR